MKVLITGTEGYIGARMAPILMESGHEVTGLDTGYYREGCLYVDPDQAPRGPGTLFKDLRRVRTEDLEGFDVVIHLAELSNDPLGQNRPAITFDINHASSVRLARAAKEVGVSRFIYASSCSVYGLGTGTELLDENAPTNPQTTYAECKVKVEKDVRALGDDQFCVTFLRNATAYGPSPRMRFDIVLNDLCALAWTSGRIDMISDGTPWRPLVHVEDIIQAFRCVMEAPWELVNREIFNVGATSENYRIREIAEVVSQVFPDCQVSAGPPGGDNRSYRVSFEKIRKELPGFRCQWTLRKGAEELRDLFQRIEMGLPEYRFRAYTRLTQIQHLLRTGQVDQYLYWAFP